MNNKQLAPLELMTIMSTQMIRKGYKNTEIGVIPVEWEVVKIGDLADIATGSTPPTNDRTNYGTDFLFVSPADLGEIKWIEKSEKKLSKKGFSISRKFPKNSILFTCIGSTIGKSGIAKIGLTSNQQINALFPNDSYNTEFAYYELQIIAKEIKAQAGEQAVPMVNKSSFAEFKIPLPPLPEQTAIATVLSDTDQLLQALQKKIAKKRLIKKGAMQELLKPKEGWVMKRLGKVFNFKQGVQCGVENQSKELKKGLIRFIRIIDLSQIGEPPRFINDPGVLHHINKNDLFMVRYGNPGLLGFGYEGVIANNLFSLNPKMIIHKPYFYHLLSFNKEKILELSSSTTMAAINFTSLRALLVSFPKSKQQQTKIAQILSDMDAEIETLEKQLAKYKQVKQGLMQVLLTGKIRLV